MTSSQSKNHLLYEVLAPKVLAYIDEFLKDAHGRVAFIQVELSKDGTYLDLLFTGSPFTPALRKALASKAPSFKAHLASTHILARMPTLRILEQKNSIDVLDILADIRAETTRLSLHDAK